MTLSDSQNQVPPQMAMLEMVSSYWVTQCIYVAAKLGIADLLKDAPKHCDELAAATNSHSDSLYRLLRALASLDIFAETQPHYFQLTPLADCLQSDVPHSIKDIALLMGEYHYQAWEHLLHSVKTGETAFEHFQGISVFEYNQQNPTARQVFDAAMTEYSAMEIEDILAVYDFSSINKLVDVGGGVGSLMASILQKHSHMKGVLFDQPEVVGNAGNVFQAAGVGDRCEIVGGSFFEFVPEGGDTYLMKHIIHDWDDERCVAILKNCYRAMQPESKLLILEYVIPPDNDYFMGKLLDINMLVMCPGGRERTEAEYRDLLKSTGFELTNVVPSKLSGIAIIEAVPITN